MFISLISMHNISMLNTIANEKDILYISGYYSIQAALALPLLATAAIQGNQLPTE